LLLKRGSDAAELVSSVLQLAEKDVDLFQVRAQGESPSVAAGRIGEDVLRAHGQALEGAFLRDVAQLKRESRWSIRIDDTAQCVLGLARTLQLISDLIGVEVPEAPRGTAEGAGSGGSGGAPGAGSQEL